MNCYKCNHLGWYQVPIADYVNNIYQFEFKKCDVCENGKISLIEWLFRKGK